MKRITLFAGILFLFCHIYAQEDTIRTRGQMMDLFFKAQKAEKSGNTQEALEIYKTILSVDANLSTPYLKMADIYAADQGNQQSMAEAAALYRKYLALQPDDENAAAIAKKAAELEQQTSYGVDLNKLLYIGKDDVQQVFATKARPGLRARNKEELVQMVDSANTLYNQVQADITEGNTQSALQNAEQIGQIDPTNPNYMQANMQLADANINKGDMQKAKEAYTSVDQNIEMNQVLSQDLNTGISDSVLFGEDICGVWISDLAYKDGIPFMAVEITRKDDQNYTATILPYCTLAQEYGMYTRQQSSSILQSMTRKQFVYEPKYNEKTNGYFAVSTINAVNSDEGAAHFYFGDKKTRGASEATSKLLANNVSPALGGLQNNVQHAIASDPTRSDRSAQVTNAAISFGGALAQGAIAAWGSYGKVTEISLDLTMKRLFTGCANADLVHTTHEKSTTGYENENSSSLKLRLYKLYQEDKILFADENNVLFGYKTFKKKEEQQAEEYKQLQTMKNKSDFNNQAYKKLSDKITSYCYAKAKVNSDFDFYAKDCYTRFEYAPKGLSYQVFSNKYGRFEGWINLAGKMNGKGKCTLSDGTTYVGSWNNNKYSGDNGKLILRDKKTNAVTVYTGTFKNNKYNGKGLLQWNGVSYEGDFVNGTFEGTGTFTAVDNSQYRGEWKNDEPVKGVITYPNGDHYEGQCLYDDKTLQIERNGEGTMAYADGKTDSGKWKNNELKTKN